MIIDRDRCNIVGNVAHVISIGLLHVAGPQNAWAWPVAGLSV